MIAKHLNFESILFLSVDLAGNYFENILIALFGMGDRTGGTIFDAVRDSEMTAAVDEVQRAPAKEAGLPVGKIVARIETAVLMHKKLVVHRTIPPSGIFLSGLPAWGSSYSPAFPS